MSDGALIWINGAPGEALPLPDRGLDFGDGLFETILLQHGRPMLLDAHLARLLKGMAVLDFPDCLQTVAGGIEKASAAIVAQGWAWTALRVTVTRGAGPRGYAPPAVCEPNLVITATRLERNCSLRLPPAKLCIADIQLSRQPALAGIKHLNRLEQVMASSQANKAGFDEALLCDQLSRVVGVAAGNVFAVFDHEILTPALRDAGVSGTRRHHVLTRSAPQLGLKVREADLTLDDFAQAREVFYTNTLVGIRSVASLRDCSWPEGPTTLALCERYFSEFA